MLLCLTSPVLTPSLNISTFFAFFRTVETSASQVYNVMIQHFCILLSTRQDECSHNLLYLSHPSLLPPPLGQHQFVLCVLDAVASGTLLAQRIIRPNKLLPGELILHTQTNQSNRKPISCLLPLSGFHRVLTFGPLFPRPNHPRARYRVTQDSPLHPRAYGNYSN